MNSIKWNIGQNWWQRPSGHILHPTFWSWHLFVGLLFIFSEFGTNMDLPFLHFPTSLRVKRPRPKGKKMRVDHSFILGFCKNVTFDTVFTFSMFSEKPTFLNYCHLLIILCISDSKMGDPRLLWFQNRTLISKL